jgi:hypothetical protein
MTQAWRSRSKYGVDISDAGRMARTRDGHVFDSLAELARYEELLLLEAGGVIRGLEIQPTYSLHVNGLRVANFRLDFRYYHVPTERPICEDVKGKATAVYRLKARMFRAEYGIDVLETTPERRRRGESRG